MAIQKVNIDEFLALPSGVPIFDVRSPSEFLHAHIPNAFSFAIFNDEERKKIGTAYKQESREIAIKIGLEFFGKKMSQLVSEAEEIFSKNKIDGKEVRVHCWRGGMRSAAIAWLLDLYGFKVYLLSGGYKAYRNWVLKQFEKEYKLLVLGGYTGGNKTGVLHEMMKRGEWVIDLENMAGHKGSAFGNLENIPQPSQEHFENLLALDLEKKARDNSQFIWIEGESQRIGTINVPLLFFRNMRNSTLLFLDIPFQKRLEHIITGYGKHDKDKLINAILRIKKRLGGLETKNAVNALLEGNVEECFLILLNYYDKLYLKSTLSKEEGERAIVYIESDTTDAITNLKKLLSYAAGRK